MKNDRFIAVLTACIGGASVVSSIPISSTLDGHSLSVRTVSSNITLLDIIPPSSNLGNPPTVSSERSIMPRGLVSSTMGLGWRYDDDIDSFLDQNPIPPYAFWPYGYSLRNVLNVVEKYFKDHLRIPGPYHNYRIIFKTLGQEYGSWLAWRYSESQREYAARLIRSYKELLKNRCRRSLDNPVAVVILNALVRNNLGLDPARGSRETLVHSGNSVTSSRETLVDDDSH